MMSKPQIEVKICGLKTAEAVECAVAAGAAYIGFNHYPASPRYIAPDEARELARLLPPSVTAVSLLVDPSEAEVLVCAPWTGMLQLHGKEDAELCRKFASLSGKQIIKAIQVSQRSDIDASSKYDGVANMLLLDAKPPTTPDALPGGNAIAFDWHLLQKAKPVLPWMLSGGLTPQNVSEAIRLTGATSVDVSSGVEQTRGEKSMDLIRAFIRAATQQN